MNQYLRFVDSHKALDSRVDDITRLLNHLTTLRDFFYVLYVVLHILSSDRHEY